MALPPKSSSTPPSRPGTIRTDWHMDIEILYRTPDEPNVPVASTRYEFGPLTINKTTSLPEGQCKLKDFLLSVNDMLSTTAQANGWPIFRVLATPYLMTADSANPGLLAEHPPNIDITSLPDMRKLDSPAGGGFPIPSGWGHGSFATDQTQDQMLIRYDLTMEDASELGLAALFYYGFKIYWHHGRHGDIPGDPLGPKGYVTINSYPDAPVVALPYGPTVGGVQAVIQDDLPLPPNIRFIPYMGVSNKLLIFMNTNTGVYSARPIVIVESDLDKLVNLFFNQKGADPQTPSRWLTPSALNTWLLSAPFRDPDAALAYSNDDPVNEYQIFRTTTKPTSYRDFNTLGAPHATPNGNISIGTETTGVTYTDDIQPNIKYYYCVRAIDIHKNFSNPTYVYEVEMIDNDGQIFMAVKPIVFQSGSKKSRTKTGRRFIYFEPSLQNLTFDQGSITTPTESITPATIPASNMLGHVTEKVWSVPHFKVRVTSKKTSRQFDINLTFANNGVTIPEE